MAGEPFRCPVCREETAGNAPTRRAARKRHAGLHALSLVELDALPRPLTPDELVIPAPDRRGNRRRR